MDWPTLFVISSVLLVLAAAACAWLVTSRSAFISKSEGLQNDLDQANQQVDSFRSEIGNLNTQIAVAQETQRGLEKQFEEAQKKARETFESLAGRVLNQSSEQFLRLAKKTFEGEQKDAAAQLEQRKQAIDALVKPIRETLDKYNSSIKDIEKARQEAYGGLRQQLGRLVEDQKLLRGETANLVKALRRPEVRGRWGEMQLRRVAELAGMIENCDFAQQVSAQTDSRRLQPDMVVRLPNNRTIVVDAKTPLDAFINAIECTEDVQREDLLNRHAQQIIDQVNSLAKKPYTQLFDRSPDFVVLFIPGESFLFPAVQRRPDLIENASAKGVIIATPTTLISLLKVIALGWREEQITESAKKISDLGRELHERLCTTVEHALRMGESITSAVRHYNGFIGSFESRVMVSARKFKDLGVESTKSLPDTVSPIEVVTRDLKSLMGPPVRQAESSNAEGD